MDPRDLQVGDRVLFDHFGAKDRPGEVVKITANGVHIRWTSPSSGKSRVVRLSTKPWTDGGRLSGQPSEFDTKNVRRIA